ncbi:PREDICTED: uncharacterized protein LOC105450945 [Wasmannia auropunctata]|uniref:uncharacterized protein LOC105450945 n=1 Tax=Wasmannia auropunctata TaxID=64793 RepID=UPI0005F072EF|nr:PREDICTED: uncharacterized protein LOC105450945 [Wasmannia auropunctata]
MALKKNISVFEGEQLYTLEILIDRLNLYPEKIINNGECDLMVRIGFVDLKPVDIIAVESIKVNNKRNKKNRFSDEYIGCEGKTCLLVRTPNDLIRSVKSTPLSIEVYWIPRGEDRNPRDDSGRVLCAATAFLPKSFYDCIAAAKNKIDGLSKSHMLTKSYTLTDEDGNPCGSTSMCLRLSCFGSSIINHLTLREKSFILRGFPLGWKFPYTKLSDEDVNDEKYKTKCNDNTSLLYKILDPTYSKSLHNQDDRIETESVLTRPKSPLRISMNQPGFEKLTSAEKLNDHKYRGLIYEIYPDEPTCSCLPTDRSTHPMMCRSGCVRSCCMALRNPDALKNFPSLATVAPDNLKSDEEQNVSYHDDTRRMRGGEDTKNDYLNKTWDEKYTWHENDVNLKNRVMGGSDCGAPAYAFSEGTTVIYEKSKERGANSLCRSRPRTADGIKTADCICSGKVSSPWKTNASKCTKKPCVGADCMIRVFKEAQEFVDSLGKVPGLVGLGLMDPSESPYFGRDIQKDYAVQETPSERKRGYPVSVPPASTIQCPAPCNTQIGKPITSIHSSPYIASSSITTAIPGRTGVVREAIPTLPPEATLLPIAVKPKKKEDKKEEKLEKQKELDVTTSVPLDVDVGPCGEPKCKSRRKKHKDDRTVPHDVVVEESEKKLIQSTAPSTIAAKVTGKFIEKGRYPKGKPGPSGDRGGPIKVSRRVMQYVYSIGDVYPGTIYGHKNCLAPRFRVPANMGWLWNTSATVDKLKPRIGWKPGAIGRYLYELLKEAKGASTLEDYRGTKSIPSRASLRRGKVQAYKSLSYVSQVKKEIEEDAEPPPTLHIHRKDGTYYVTMYPIRQETGDVSQLEEPMKPLQFKIARNKDDASVASSSTASDMEIEFSPPAAVSRYRRKPDVIHVDTQVRQQEILDAFKLTTVDSPKPKERKGKRERKEKK